jgi:uncharacterized membrane protein YfcA
LIGAPLSTRLLQAIPNPLLGRSFFLVLVILGRQILWKARQGNHYNDVDL